MLIFKKKNNLNQKKNKFNNLILGCCLLNKNCQSIKKIKVSNKCPVGLKGQPGKNG